MLAEIRKCAEAHDIKGLRYIFVDSLDVDPTFEKYKEDYEFCKGIPGLFEAHQPLKGIVPDKDQWTMQYWEQLKLDLMKNFSEIRFEHMIEVAKVVYSDKIARLLNERSMKRRSSMPTGNASAGSVPVETPKRTVSSENVPVEPLRHPVSSAPVSRTVSGAERQEKQLAEAQRALEEKNRHIEAEQAAQRARIEAGKREAERRRQSMQNESYGSKKGMGIVLKIIVAVVVIGIVCGIIAAIL